MANQGRKPMPEDIYLKIKEFQKQGCTNVAFVADQVGWSKKVVSRSFAANTYEEYLQSGTKKKIKENENNEKNVISNIEKMPVLERIAESLEMIAEELVRMNGGYVE